VPGAGTGASSSAETAPGLTSRELPPVAPAALAPALAGLLLSDFVTVCTTDGFEAAAARLSVGDAQTLRETSQLLASLDGDE